MNYDDAVIVWLHGDNIVTAAAAAAEIMNVNGAMNPRSILFVATKLEIGQSTQQHSFNIH